MNKRNCKDHLFCSCFVIAPSEVLKVAFGLEIETRKPPTFIFCSAGYLMSTRPPSSFLLAGDEEEAKLQ